ncbi:phage antirepressor Ant [Alcaligenaceae bacterium 429]|nr:phage antirepressor Ant [Alcaligenaceae bacterium 429]
MSNIKTLIPVSAGDIGGEAVKTVNARDLHAYLEVRSEFRNWIKNRIDDFEFVENQDFTTVGRKLPSGGRQNDYFVTLDMAKELSMVERNHKGKEARQYFIECERQAKAVVSIPQSLPEALRLAAEAIEERDRLVLENQAKAEVLAITEPKALAFDRIAAAEDTLTITQASKVLGVKRTYLTAWLVANGWVYRQNGSLVGYDRHERSGYLSYKEARYTDENIGQEIRKPYCHITPKGLTVIAKRLNIELRDVSMGAHLPQQLEMKSAYAGR